MDCRVARKRQASEEIDQNNSRQKLIQLEPETWSDIQDDNRLRGRLLEYIFTKILKSLAEFDLFGKPDSKSFFLVYAHDNSKMGISLSRQSRCIIDWLNILRTKIFSDRTVSQEPLFPREDVEGTVTDILSNQFCLLPQCTAETSNTIGQVDDVIFCCSEVLENYYKHDQMIAYISDIKDCWERGLKSSASFEEVKNDIKHIVTEQIKANRELGDTDRWFHHVLTEMAFLEIRSTYKSEKQHRIISIILNGDGIENYPFVNSNTNLYRKLQTQSDSMVHESQGSHRLLFNLLLLMYPYRQDIINEFNNCYNECATLLSHTEPLLSDNDLKEKVAKKIAHAVQRLTDRNQAIHRNTSSSSIQREESDLIRKCLQDLHVTDPDADMARIESTKDTLLKDCYQWILNDQELQDWQNKDDCRLLWIRGDPGKGKTMLMIALVHELRKRASSRTARLAFFFCQSTVPELKNIDSVLRGLIWKLVHEDSRLAPDLLKDYTDAGEKLFSSSSATTKIWSILSKILSNPILPKVYILIDAVDECDIGWYQLLKFITKNAADPSSKAKWLLSSRNYPEIQEILSPQDNRCILNLELNASHVSQAVNAFIDYKSNKLAEQKNYPNNLKLEVNRQIKAKAESTFLWAALVLKELEKVGKYYILKVLEELPLGLTELYNRMIQQIDKLLWEDPQFCRLVLSTITFAHRPLHLLELGALSGLPEELSDDPNDVRDVVNNCGSFLTIREDTIYLVHQSAKDFLLKEASNDIFPSKVEDVHYAMFSKSLQVIGKTLKCDNYSLKAAGVSIDQVKKPDPDPLAAARYSCLHWVDHLIEYDIGGKAINDLTDNGSVHKFLCQKYLYWLEALSLLKASSSGIVMIRKLENLVQTKATDSPSLYAFLHDAKRFALYSRSVIEQTPLQAYSSALVFAPEQSIVRRTFEKCIPLWIQRKPKVPTHWSAVLQTLEGHTAGVRSVAFSPDGKQVVSGSDDHTVRLWDAATGQQVLPPLEGHTAGVRSVAFSPDGKQVVSGSFDRTVRLWDAATGQQVLPPLEGHTAWVRSVAFAPDGKQVVSGSFDRTVRLWDAATGQQVLPPLEGHTAGVRSVAFAPDGKQVVSGSFDRTVRLWDAATGQQVLPPLEGHTDRVRSVAFSPDGKQVVSGSFDRTVRLWDAATGQQVLPPLEGHTARVSSVAFAPDGKQVVSGSDDRTVRLWDAATGQQVLPPLEGHTARVSSVAFAPDGKQVVSGSDDRTVRLWDAATGQQVLPPLEGHIAWVSSVAFAPDGKQVVSGSDDRTVRLWDAATGQQVLPPLEGHTAGVNSVAFAPDGKQVVSGSFDHTVRLWDVATGQQVLPPLEGHTAGVNSVAFAPDGKQVVSRPENQLLQHTLVVSNDWIIKDGLNILWLPPEYRTSEVAIWGGIIVLGRSSGKVSFLEFS